jgi:hypothetical protein
MTFNNTGRNVPGPAAARKQYGHLRYLKCELLLAR